MPRRLTIPLTPRLERLAAAWKRNDSRPDRVTPPPPGSESVWDYPRPPAVEEVDVRACVLLGDRCVAESERCLRVLERARPPTLYFPPADVDQALLRPEHGSSFCEWKGRATYFSIVAGDRRSRQAAWSYPEPLLEYQVLAGYLAFYPARVTACWVGEHPVTPQPGHFYGGWVTPDLCGPFKGEPGSEGW
jgi:uncharacterized protein (DUF427 family)